MNEIVNDKNLVAYCGLYCGSCGAFRRNRCKGCHYNDKATWCKIRTCCKSNNYSTCAECKEHHNTRECSFVNNFISKIFAFIFKSDRNACIDQIRSKGLEYHAQEMSSTGLQSIKKS